MLTVKKKRKDNFKNRNKPAKSSWPVKPFATKEHAKGMVCGRCGAIKKEGKCENRWTVGKLHRFFPNGTPDFVTEVLKDLKDKHGCKFETMFFCIDDQKAFV